MLLSCLQSHTIGQVIISINWSTNNSTWHFSNVLLFGCKKAWVRTTKTHRHSESLSRSKAYISSHISWSFGNSEGKEIRSYNFDGSALWGRYLIEEISKVMEYSFFIWCLNNDSKVFFRIFFLEELSIISNHNFNIQKTGFCFDDCFCSFEDIFIHKELISLTIMDVITHI